MANSGMREARDALEQGSSNPGVARGRIERSTMQPTIEEHYEMRPLEKFVPKPEAPDPGEQSHMDVVPPGGDAPG